MRLDEQTSMEMYRNRLDGLGKVRPRDGVKCEGERRDEVLVNQTGSGRDRDDLEAGIDKVPKFVHCIRVRVDERLHATVKRGIVLDP